MLIKLGLASRLQSCNSGSRAFLDSRACVQLGREDPLDTAFTDPVPPSKIAEHGAGSPRLDQFAYSRFAQPINHSSRHSGVRPGSNASRWILNGMLSIFHQPEPRAS